MISMRTQVEIWQRYGAYLTGVTGLSSNNPNATFAQFIAACGHNRGGWSDIALRNAWDAGR